MVPQSSPSPSEVKENDGQRVAIPGIAWVRSPKNAPDNPCHGTIRPVTPWTRCILHADLDAFFASVEQLDQPRLRGRPVLVGGSGDRGVVAAASYEARAFGCRSAMPMRAALRQCPQAVVVPPRFDRYAELSRSFRAILLDHAPCIEPLSVDEAFVDVTGSQRLLGAGPLIARSIRSRTREELGLTVSVGVAPSKFVAKIASDMRKPDGCTVIPPEQVVERLAPLPIERMWGVGPRSAPLLHARGIHTFADLQARSAAAVQALLGDRGVAWRSLALGMDDRPVEPEREARSVGHEETFDRDEDDPDFLAALLQEQCERVGLRLRAGGGHARAVSLKLRTPDFQTFSRQRTLEEPTDTTAGIWRVARELLHAWLRDRPGPLRLLGLSVERVEAAGTPGLFQDPQRNRERAIDAVTDRAARRFGPDALRRAGSRAAGRRSTRDARADDPRPEAG